MDSAAHQRAGILWSRLVERSFDAAPINAIFNDPKVYPFVAKPDSGKIDIAPLIREYKNILLVGEYGGILFVCREPCVYQVHTGLKPRSRAKENDDGPHRLAMIRAAYAWMFTHTDCTDLLTAIPQNNRAAWFFAPLAGWTKEFERKETWPTHDGAVDQSFWSLRYDDWVRKTPELMASGKWFHRRLEEEYERVGFVELRHAQEDCHDRHVGACLEMLCGGQYEKAVVLYNRWARFADYGQVALASKSPVLIDIGEAVIQIKSDDFQVIRCRSQHQ